MYTVWCTSKFIIPCSIFDIQKKYSAKNYTNIIDKRLKHLPEGMKFLLDDLPNEY